MLVYLNGRMIQRDRARVHLDDAGFQHAVGLFETMSAHHGTPFRLQAHLRRLGASATALGLVRALDTEALAGATLRTLEENGLQEARVRVTVTGGGLSMRSPAARGPQAPDPTVVVVAEEPVRYDPGYFDRGISVVVAPPAANPFDPLAGHKTLSYWGRLRTLRQAAAAGAGEAIWLNVSNHLASGAVSNVFLVKDEQLFTPIARGEEAPGALAAPVLPGITRAAVRELAEAAKIPVHQRMLGVNELLGADEVFLTNSGWHVLPVTRVEQKSIGSGAVGPLTKKFRTEVLELIERETADPAPMSP